MARPFDDADVAGSQVSKAGYVYCFTHENMRATDGGTIAKIGATRKHPIQRATELSGGTGVPGMFTVAYWRRFDDAFATESRLHEALAAVRVDPAREFFKVEVMDSIRLLRQLAEEMPGDGREGGEWIESGAADGLRASVEHLYPFAALFASFDPDGPAELTPEEQARCRALEARPR